MADAAEGAGLSLSSARYGRCASLGLGVRDRRISNRGAGADEQEKRETRERCAQTRHRLDASTALAASRARVQVSSECSQA